MNFPSLINQLAFAFSLLFFCHDFAQAQHTFSIVAVDPETGEVGSAGATCLNNDDCNGCGGAVVISGLLPGRGAVCSQASVCIPNSNLLNAIGLMDQGDSPSEILSYLLENDACGFGDNTVRQYGIADLSDSGEARLEAYTGEGAEDYANHLIGENFTVQGNILIGSEVLFGMKNAFEAAEGNLTEKLMAAMQGANIPGADSRCLDEGTSSRSAFLRVACPPEDAAADCRNIDIVIPQLATGDEPIDALQERLDEVLAMTETVENDICPDATVTSIQGDADSCVAETGNLSMALSSSVPITDCEYTHQLSDLWYSFNLGDAIPATLSLDPLYDPENPGDVGELGCALYTSCSPLAFPLFCTRLAPNDPLLLPLECMETDRDYFLKFWDASEGAGGDRFSFCLHSGESNGGLSVIWGDGPNEGGFENGLAGWTSNGISDAEHVWTWSEDGSFIGGLTAPTLNSISRCNGSVGFMAGFYAADGNPDFIPEQPYELFTGELISPIIDLSESVLPILQFSQFFAGLNGNNATGTTTEVGALIAWSDDGGATWSDAIPVNDDYAANVFSPNPDSRQVPLAELAGSEQARIKFIFDGDFYFWLIDDVLILENGVINTGIDLGYYVIPENYLTPFHQFTSIPLGGLVHNYGGVAPTNLQLNTSIDWTTAAGSTLPNIHSKSTAIELAPGTNEFVSFPADDLYLPDANMDGILTVHYNLSQSEPDSEPTDNTAQAELQITNNILSKGPITEDGKPYHDTFWGPIDPGPYEYGFHFYLPNSGTVADSVMLGCSAPAGETLEGTEIEIYIHRWENSDPLNEISNDELSIVAFSTYQFTDEANEEFITVRLIGNPVITQGVELDAGHYIITMSYEGENNLYMNANSTIDYSATIENSFILANQEDDSSLFRYADIVRLGSNWFTGGFDGPGIPAMNLYLNSPSVANEHMETDLHLQITQLPNALQLSRLWAASALNYSIASVNGSILKNGNIQRSELTSAISLQDLPTGIYLLQVQDKNGAKLQHKFVLSR